MATKVLFLQALYKRQHLRFEALQQYRGRAAAGHALFGGGGGSQLKVQLGKGRRAPEKFPGLGLTSALKGAAADAAGDAAVAYHHHPGARGPRCRAGVADNAAKNRRLFELQGAGKFIENMPHIFLLSCAGRGWFV